MPFTHPSANRLLQTELLYREQLLDKPEWPETMTEQHHLENVKMANLVINYQRTGVFHHLAKQVASFSNFIDVPDFQTAQMIVAEAKSTFERIPPEIRAKFGNDAVAFVDAASDPENKQMLMEMGFDASYLPDPIPPTPSEPLNAPVQAESPTPADGSPAE